MLKYNPAFVSSAKSHLKREEFFKRYQSENLNKLISKLINTKPLIVKVVGKIINRIFK